MSMYLAYSYSIKMRKSELVEDNLRVKRNQKEALAGALFATALYSAYCLLPKAVHASDSIPNGGPGIPNPVNSANQVATAPPSKNGLNDMQKGAFAGSTTGICGLALQTSNFWLGFACVGLLIVGSKVMATE